MRIIKTCLVSQPSKAQLAVLRNCRPEYKFFKGIMGEVFSAKGVSIETVELDEDIKACLSI